MTCNDIYLAALRKIGDPSTGARTDDYTERAPYILASVIADLAALDGQYRLSVGEQAPDPFAGASIPLTEPFPLSDRFAGVTGDYVASLLTVDEDSALSDRFFESFLDGVAKITAEIPAERQKILDVYGV